MIKTLNILDFIDKFETIFMLYTEMGKNRGLIIAKGKPLAGGEGPTYVG